MKKNSTEIVCVIDRSGSMERKREDVIGGLNSFFEAQKKEPGKCVVTYVQFDDQIETVREAENLKDLKPLSQADYEPRGMTRLLDALGLTIKQVGTRLDLMPEHRKPEHVIVVVMTDGQENDSREYSRDQINELIKRQTDVYNWEFVFLGASQEAIAEAQALGMRSNLTAKYVDSKMGTSNAMFSASESVSALRSGVRAASYESMVTGDAQDLWKEEE